MGLRGEGKLSHQHVPPDRNKPLIYKGREVLVEAAGIEPASEDPTSLALHA